MHVHLEHLDHVDHACFELLSDWRARYESRGGEVTLEWDTLEERGYRPTERTDAPSDPGFEAVSAPAEPPDAASEASRELDGRAHAR